MNIIDLILIGLSLSMDALALSVIIGLSYSNDIRRCFSVSLYFGIFQSLMPLLGFFLGSYFKCFLESFDHFVMVAILLYLGFKMIKEAIFNEQKTLNLNNKTLIMYSLSCSIDAFAIGITFSMLHVKLFLAVSIIGLITFVMSFIGMMFGSILSKNSPRNFQIVGAVVLISLAIKILFEHLHIV